MTIKTIISNFNQAPYKNNYVMLNKEPTNYSQNIKIKKKYSQKRIRKQ